MRRVAWTLIMALLPVGVFALDYSKSSLQYTDAPFGPADAAAISVLTGIEAVEGNPDGSFAPLRLLNRAEFLKIALASHPGIRASKSDAADCFPDVRKDDWFSPYICLAKKRGIVEGYPDGMFKPAQNVNYAEALKMLGELYTYTAYADPEAEWFEMYVQAAKNHKTILPVNLQYDRWINRGQMARLAAAYHADFVGELDLYRMAERGEDVVAYLREQERLEQEASAASQQSSSASSAQSSSAESSVSSSSSVESVYLPSVQRLLLVGQRSGPIADATLRAKEKPGTLRIVKAIFENEVRSFSKVFLVDGTGKEIAEMTLDAKDPDDETWKFEFGPNTAASPLLSENADTAIAFEATLKAAGQGGFSEERVQVKTIFVTVSDADDQSVNYQIIPKNTHYPIHQTALARILSVENALGSEGVLESGSVKELAAFAISGETVEGGRLRISNLRFHVEASPGVLMDNWQLGADGSIALHACSAESGDTTLVVNCLAIPDEIGDIVATGGTRVLRLYGDIDIDASASEKFLQIKLSDAGSLSAQGDVVWTDGSSQFQWVTLPEPLAEGPRWTK